MTTAVVGQSWRWVFWTSAAMQVVPFILLSWRSRMKSTSQERTRTITTTSVITSIKTSNAIYET